jgi:outer membrane protein W
LGEGAIVLKLKGYFKAKVNDTDISNSFNYSKNVIIDARLKDEVNLNANPSKTEIKEQKKMEKKMKKNEKDKRKFQNQVES